MPPLRYTGLVRNTEVRIDRTIIYWENLDPDRDKTNYVVVIGQFELEPGSVVVIEQTECKLACGPWYFWKVLT